MDDDKLDIPEFLRRYPGEPPAVWPPSVAVRQEPAKSMTFEEWTKKKREIKIARNKDKNAKGLAKLKAKHEGQRYDRKNKVWVKVTAEVTT